MNIISIIIVSFFLISYLYMLREYADLSYLTFFAKEKYEYEYYLAQGLLQYGISFYEHNSFLIAHAPSHIYTLDLQQLPSVSSPFYQGSITFKIENNNLIITASLLKNGKISHTVKEHRVLKVA